MLATVVLDRLLLVKSSYICMLLCDHFMLIGKKKSHQSESHFIGQFICSQVRIRFNIRASVVVLEICTFQNLSVGIHSYEPKPSMTCVTHR